MMKTNFLKSFSLILFLCLGLSAWGQINEGFDSTTFPPTDWINEGTIRSTNNPRTGSASLAFNGKDDAITSPLVANPSLLSFWYKRSSNTAAWGLKIEILDASNSIIGTLTPIVNASTTYTEYTADLSSYNTCRIKLTDTRSSGGAERYLDDFTITITESTDPTLSANPTSISDLNYVEGNGPSSSGSFTLSASNWDDSNVELLVDEEFEISDNETDWTDYLELTAYDGSDKTIYVRMKSGLSIDDYTGTVLISGGSAEVVSVDLSGSVTAPPPVTSVSETTLSGFTYVLGNGPSAEQNFTVSGNNLTSDITVTAPSNYQISLTTGSGYENSVTLTPADGTVNTTTIYVRLVAGLEVNSYNGNITIATTGVADKTVALSGSVTCGASPIPYSEDFESVTTPDLPACTTVVQGGSGNLWTTSSPNESGFTSKALTYQWHGNNNANTWFFTNGLQLEGGQSYRLSFRYGNNSTSYNENLKVAYGTSNTIAGMTVELADYPNINDNTPHSVTINFEPATTGVYYIGFQAYSEADNYMLYVDDILVEENAPTISTDPAIVPAFTAVTGETDTEDITISGLLLTNGINITLGGTNADQYSVSTNSLGSEGGTLTLTYEPTTAGSHTATVTLSSTGADDVVLDLNGTATLGVPVATAATEISSSGFTANWEEVPGAESYEIDVYTMESGGFATDLFISEYVEGSSNNKAIEIYNGTENTIDLSNYTIIQFNNGATRTGGTRYALELSGNLQSGSTYVIVNNNADNTLKTYADLTISNATLNFNGDDALAIYRSEDVTGTEIAESAIEIDIFGKIGEDPGSEWGTEFTSTADNTLRRKSSISGGVTTNPESFDPAVEWDGFASNTFDDLGSHTFDGGLSVVYHLQAENVGNVTSYEVTGLDPETTYYYVIRAIAGEETTANSNEVEVTTTEIPAAITWLSTNEWSNVDGPTINDDAVIEGDLVISGALDLLAKNFTISTDGSVTIQDDGSLTLSGKLTNNADAADFVVENGGNFVQTSDYETDDNEGAITVKRNSQDIVRLDYTMWASPVKNQGLQAFSPETLWNRIYTYETNSGNVGTNGAYVSVFASESDADIDFENGKGYLFRAPNDWPIPAGSAEGDPYLAEFIGEPKNGNVSVSTFNGGYTSIGNPYPSNIDPDALMDANDNLSTIYFWNNPPRVETEPGSGEYTYTGTKYVTFSTAGFVPSDYNGSSISTGQGFIVYSTGNSINFDNSMRVTAQENFFKTDEIEMNRYWIRLSNDQNQTAFNELLVNYMEGATNEVDQQIDAKLFGYNGSALFNLINEEAYVIQGRALPFADTDVVPLGFKAEEAGKFIISLANFDGLFAEGETTIYLKDKALNITHNLMESDYAFESEAGEFNNRFEVVYAEGEVMNVDDLTANGIIIYKNGENFMVQSTESPLTSVQVFDIQGRLIHSNSKLNAMNYEFKPASTGVFVVKAQIENGKVSNKKIVNY